MDESSERELVSTEELSSDSPVMWPDVNFFGEFNPLHLSPAPPKWLVDIQKDDYEMINKFASLTHSQLMERVRALQNKAFQLGVEEAKQMSRGKYLDIFEPSQPKPLPLEKAATVEKKTHKKKSKYRQGS